MNTASSNHNHAHITESYKTLLFSVAKQTMKKTYLGKLWLHWCHHCNVPVLDETCNTCSNSTEKVNITPPGDIRPGFKHDIDFINSITTTQFGTPLIPPDRLVVLNRAPFEDRMDEVIFDGFIMGSLRFEIETQQWMFLPRPVGAARIFNHRSLQSRSNWVIIDNSAVSFIREGANVMAPGVIDADENIKAGDEVVVLTPQREVVACGRARMRGREMVESKRGVAVKNRWHGGAETVNLQGGQTWDDAVAANQHVLKERVQHALKFIRNVTDTTKLPVAVSYSGGKDSLATLLLVRDAGVDFDLLFVDTGLEFPETLENVRQVSNEYQLNLIHATAGDAFWKSVEYFGPPSVETRWCCKLCKLGPITQLIEKHYPQGCLTFIGQRKYESSARAKSEHVWKNPWVGNQIGASPIQNWTALHVWLYLFSKKAPYNPLYEQGFRRIGCWLCPSSDISDLLLIAKTHPRLWARYAEVLHAQAKHLGLGEGWVEYHLWRWQNPPKSHRELAEKLGINLNVRKTGAPETFSIVSGHRPCARGGISVEAAFDKPLNLEEIESSGMLRCLGDVASMDGVINLQVSSYSTQIFATGSITARGESEDAAIKMVEDVAGAIKRALNCRGCGLCVGQCEVKAVKLKDSRAWVSERCTACRKCIPNCPVVRFESYTVSSSIRKGG
jgi:phosphoadenosine phosphosulfate reductase